MSNKNNFSQSISISYNNSLNPKINLNKNQNLIPFIDISKGKIITLLKTVFSFLNDGSLLKNDSPSSFEKYFIDNKFIQTMSKTYYFYISNYPENGKISLHELIKERYAKFIKYYEQNIHYFSNSKELEYRYYLIQGFILLWLIETKYDTQYYDDFIRVVNGLIRLDNNNNGDNNENKYLNNFLKIIVKFPFIKQHQNMIIKILEVNECSDLILNAFNNNLNDIIQKKNLSLKQDIFNDRYGLNTNLGKKNIISKNEDSYFPLIQENSLVSHTNKRKTISNKGSLFSSINSSGFYTPEFKHSKRDSIIHFRRFTMNNINNPKTSINTKYNYLKSNAITEGMNNLLSKCEEAKHSNSNNHSFNINKNTNNKFGQKSTKSKIRQAVQGHFYTENDYKNNIEIENEPSTISINNEIMPPTDINKITDDNNIFEDEEENETDEIESKLVSVDELPINPNMSMISSSTSNNIGLEPENIIEETKEEEEIDENDQVKINNNVNSNNNTVKILTDNEINDFFKQQFSDNKNKNNKINKANTNTNNIINNNRNKKRNLSNSNINNIKKNNTSKSNSVNNRNDINNKDKEKKNNNNQNQNKYQINSNLFKEKNSKENNNLSVQEKMKNYSSSNVFGILKNHKNKKDIMGLKNKNDNIILQPCTKGKETVDNVMNNTNNLGNENISKEILPTESVAKKNLFTLYNQLKGKK